MSGCTQSRSHRGNAAVEPMRVRGWLRNSDWPAQLLVGKHLPLLIMCIDRAIPKETGDLLITVSQFAQYGSTVGA